MTTTTDDTLDENDEKFFNSLVANGWCATTKTELEAIIFAYIVDSGRFNNKLSLNKGNDVFDKSTFELAEILQTTPTKVRRLLYRYQQLSFSGKRIPVETIDESIYFTPHKNDPRRLFLHTKKSYIKEYLYDKLLKRQGYVSRTADPEILEVDILCFLLVYIDDLCDDAEKHLGKTKKQIDKAKDKFKSTLEDETKVSELFDQTAPSFKAFVTKAKRFDPQLGVSIGQLIAAIAAL